MSHPISKRALIGCLSGLMAGLVFVAPAPPCRAEEDTPAPLVDQPRQVAESVLNQDPKPRPVMRHREEVPPSAVAPSRVPRATSQALTGEPAGNIKKTKKKKRKSTTAAVPSGSKSSAKAKTSTKAKTSVKAKLGKAKSETTIVTKTVPKKSPAKTGKRKAKKNKAR